MGVTGRVFQARALLLKVAQHANESGKRTVWWKASSRAAAFSTRQCCYAAQRSWIKGIVRQADAEGKNPEAWLREQLLDGVKGEFVNTPPATWPGASILYKCVNGEHYLVFEFRRIASDPLWADMITENLSVEAPQESKLNASDIVEEFK